MISKAKIKLIRSLEQKKHRLEENLFVAEGHKVIEELSKLISPVEVYEGEDAMQVSFLQHPQGLLALFPLDIMEKIKTVSSLKLALDGIQDPGNLGTIIRVCDWFGVDHILCSQNTVDCFNPKVVQATMGSLARVKVEYCDLYTRLSTLHSQLTIYDTLLTGEDIYKEKLQKENSVIVMGNEGNGVSEEIRKLADRHLLIPSFPPGRPTAESLNVSIATSIILSEFRHRL